MSFKPSTGESGFTLIEILVVVAIIAFISVIALPSIGTYFQISLNSATREIASTIKESFNSAVVTGRIYRLVFDVKNQQYWVESGPANALLDTAETKQKEERKRRFSLSSNPKQSQFSLDSTVTRKKKPLPRGVVFEDVVSQRSKDPITDGIAYSHFFPQGVTEETIIHLTDSSKHHVSLVIAPLLGQTDLYDRYVPANEIYGQ